MSGTVLHTRRLIEHRYGRPLERLRNEVARSHTIDPVLPIVLRHLDALAHTAERSRATARALRADLRHGRREDRHRHDRKRQRIAELCDLDQQEQSHAEAVWDLLDIRLLLDQPPIGHATAPRLPHTTAHEDVIDVARKAAVGLPRLTRDALRLALHDHGIHISNHRIGLVLQQLRAERPR